MLITYNIYLRATNNFTVKIQIYYFMANTEKNADKNSEKLKALKLTIDKIDKDYGKGSVMMMNERSQEPQAVISTGSIGLGCCIGHWWLTQREG